MPTIVCERVACCLISRREERPPNSQTRPVKGAQQWPPCWNTWPAHGRVQEPEGLDKDGGQATEQRGCRPAVHPECPGVRFSFSKVKHLFAETQQCEGRLCGSVHICVPRAEQVPGARCSMGYIY